MHIYTSIPYKHIFDRCKRNWRGVDSPGVHVQSQKPRGSRVNSILLAIKTWEFMLTKDIYVDIYVDI